MEPDKNIVYVDYTMLASGGKRFANYLVDFFAMYAMTFCIGILAVMLDRYFQYDGLLIWVSKMAKVQELVFGAVVTIIYYGLIESLTSRTLGKYITKTKVVMEDGSRPEAGTILLRTLCRIIPFEAFSFLGSTARGWHDSLSKTYVIDVKKYEEAVQMKNLVEEIGRTEL